MHSFLQLHIFDLTPPNTPLPTQSTPNTSTQHTQKTTVREKTLQILRTKSTNLITKNAQFKGCHSPSKKKKRLKQKRNNNKKIIEKKRLLKFSGTGSRFQTACRRLLVKETQPVLRHYRLLKKVWKTDKQAWHVGLTGLRETTVLWGSRAFFYKGRVAFV